ncbi:hypothetical protein IFM89_022957 [Coptis chinensis]|uniref:Uncharacterized protein n=1 Tax=Coptis chinensis TaxID=261450 RepID=A0A835HNU9_9MAGN|nr:hypothetical protein IFM89_022957 [Coptis chinensis]
MSASSATICHSLVGLKELYECVDDLLQLPLTQQSIGLERHEKWVDQILDGSLRLLDVCGTTRDVLSQMKQNVQDLQSSLRKEMQMVMLQLKSGHTYL